TVTLGGEETEILKDYLLINISAKKGFAVETDNNLFVILDTVLTEELIDEGYAREFVSKVQQMRKSNDYEVMDNIKVFFSSEEEFVKAIEKHKEYIMKETLAVSIENVIEGESEKLKLNGHDVCLRVERVIDESSRENSRI
ncbi:MAG: DUF5915 domain-containing protein, partial [Clostridiales bacterium]|nr:DUF5915 domain-containing protein [Clostridiales bacterium]